MLLRIPRLVQLVLSLSVSLSLSLSLSSTRLCIYVSMYPSNPGSIHLPIFIHNLSSCHVAAARMAATGFQH